MKNAFNRGIRRRVLAAVLALSIFEAGCFGSFKLTQAIWKFNRGISHDKWIQWVLFLPLAIFQVYSIGALADVLVLNSIEFWTGRNPVTADGSPWEKEVLLADGTTAHMVAEDEDTLRITHRDKVIRLRKEAGSLLTLDEEGNLLSVVREADGGAIERVAANGETRRIEAWEVAAAGSDVDALVQLAAAR